MDENVDLFVKYSRKMFAEYGKRIDSWATFNEPTCYTFCSYVAGVHAPGKVFSVFTAGIVLKNILKAHIFAYKAMKSMPHGSQVMVGLVHHHIRFEPGGDSWLHIHSK